MQQIHFFFSVLGEIHYDSLPRVRYVFEGTEGVDCHFRKTSEARNNAILHSNPRKT
jgi:hypothetical protein